MEHTANQITLRGSLVSLPQFSHENHGRRFFRFSLEVPRLSGAVDILPVIAEEPLLLDTDLTDGEMLTVAGQVRSHNIRRDGKRHLLIFVFANAILCEDGAPSTMCSWKVPSAGNLLTGGLPWAGKSAM